MLLCDAECSNKDAFGLCKLPECDRKEAPPKRIYINECNVLDDGSFIPAACRHCPNHPSNGGGGVCMCSLGSPVYY